MPSTPWGSALARLVVFDVARRQPGSRTAPTRLGALPSCRRSALYRVEPGAFVAIAELHGRSETTP